MTFYSFYTGEQVMACLWIRVICGESPKVNQRRWTKVGRRQLVHPSTPLIISVERNCLHFSLWLIQPCWSTWGTRVNAPLVLLVLPYIPFVLYQDVQCDTYKDDNCYCHFRTSRFPVWVRKTARRFILWFRLLQILWDPKTVRIPRHRIIIGPVSVSFLCSSFFG